MKKIVLINIAVILCLLILAEAILDFNLYINHFRHTKYTIKYDFIYRTFEKIYEDCNFRPVSGLEYKRRPVVIFGCSFAYGDWLEDNQTFGYKLSRLTKRPVYNRAHPGWGIQHMLWQLQHDSALDDIKAPEYVIFVFINDHFYRLITDFLHPFEYFETPRNYPYMTYVEKNGRLEVKKHPFSFFYNSFLGYNLLSLKGHIKLQSAQKDPKEAAKLGEFVKLHFREAKTIIDTKYPGAKTVILKYEPACLAQEYIWDDLAQEGFIILDANELTGQNLSASEYKFPDSHPVEAAWDLLVPALVKKLGL